MSPLNTIRFIAYHPLNRDNKLRSILRFARWQIQSRLASGPVVYDWINGSKFLARAGETGLTGNIYTGLHEFQDMAFLLHVLRDTDLCVDVGSNAGSYTILACAANGARGYAFEPIPGVYDRLVDNIRLNRLENRVKCMNVGLGREPGSLLFTSDMDTANHALAAGEQSAAAIRVEITTLDTALRDEAPALMKIDVEGFETPVLEGALETLKNPTLHSVIMELNGSGGRYGFDESKILAMMFDYGFKTYSYDPLNRTLTSLHGKNHDSGNTLFIRNEPFVLERLRNAPVIAVHGKQF